MPESRFVEWGEIKELMAATYAEPISSKEYLAQYGPVIQAARPAAHRLAREVAGKSIDCRPGLKPLEVPRVLAALPTLYAEEAALSLTKGDKAGWLEAVHDDLVIEAALCASPALFPSRAELQLRLFGVLANGLRSFSFTEPELRSLYDGLGAAPEIDEQAVNELRLQFQFGLLPRIAAASTEAYWKQRLASWAGPPAGEFDGSATLAEGAADARASIAAMAKAAYSGGFLGGGSSTVLPALGQYPSDNNPWNLFWQKRAFYQQIAATPNALGRGLSFLKGAYIEVCDLSFQSRTAVEMLRAVLAIRIYQASHGGDLPKSLSALSTLGLGGPPPRNLFRGGSFDYDGRWPGTLTCSKPEFISYLRGDDSFHPNIVVFGFHN